MRCCSAKQSRSKAVSQSSSQLIKKRAPPPSPFSFSHTLLYTWACREDKSLIKQDFSWLSTQHKKGKNRQCGCDSPQVLKHTERDAKTQKHQKMASNELHHIQRKQGQRHRCAKRHKYTHKNRQIDPPTHLSSCREKDKKTNKQCPKKKAHQL